MSVPEIIKSALPINAAASSETSTIGVSTPKPVKSETQATPFRVRNPSNILTMTPANGNFDRSEPSNFLSKGKNPPKPPEEFYKDLQQFHERRGTPIMQVPKISGKPIDLHLLYSEVVERGGFQKVNMRDEWDEVLSALDSVHDKCVNATAAIKLIYRRCLDKYERLNYFGEDPDKMEALEASIDPPEIGGRSRSRYPLGIMHSSSGGVNTVPMSYNYRQHNVSMDRRRQHKLSTDLHKPSPYEKLMLSLMSPLPNEQDFAINVCTLMTNEPKHTLKLNEYPKLLDVLLAHAGVFPDYTMRKLFQHIYTDIRRHSLYGFWRDLLVEKPQILELYTDEQDMRESGLLDESDLVDSNKDENDIDDCLAMDFFNLGRGEGTQDYVGQRVQQVVQILRNLSFFDENLLALAKNRTFLRFVVMCSNVRWGNIHVQALEMAGNVANDIDLADPTIDDLSRSLMGTLCDGIEGMDRGVILNCLEILYKICSKEGNEEYVNRCLSLEFYKRLCLYLSLNDIMLLIFTLEAIYALTSMGARSCALIMQVRGIVDQLVALITVEARSYGPDGYILMRVVETLPGNMLPMVAQNIANLQNVAVGQKQTMNHSPSQQSLQVIEQQQQHQQQPHQHQQQHQLQPQMIVEQKQQQQQSQQLPQQQTPVNTPAPAPPQNFTHEDEQYALGWLGATFERAASVESHIEQNELYRMYLAHCQRSGKHSVVNHVAFPRLVRLIFNQNVGPVIVRLPDGKELPSLHYVAIRVRAQPLPIQGGKSNLLPISPRSDQKLQKIDILSGRKLKKKLKEQQMQQQIHQQQQQQSLPTQIAKPVQEVTPPSANVAIKTETMTQCNNTINSQPSAETEPKLPVKQEQPKLMQQPNVTETPMDIDEDIATKVQAEPQQKAVEAPIPQTQPTMATTSTAIPTTALTSTQSTASEPTQQTQSPSTSLIKSLLANKVNQRQQKQKELITTNSSITHAQTSTIQTAPALTTTTTSQQTPNQPLKIASTALSALVNNPLMQNASLKVGQTTIKPLHSQSALDKKPMITDSAPPPLAPLSGNNVVNKEAAGRSLIISNQVVLDTQNIATGSIIKRKIIEEHIETPKRITLEVEQVEEEETIVTPSKNAANLYAEMAASILEDEDLDDIPPLATSTQQQTVATAPAIIEQHQQPTHPQAPIIIPPQIQQPQPQQQPQLANVQRQLLFQTSAPTQQTTQLKMSAPTAQPMSTAMATIKTDQGLQTVPVILQQKPMEQSQIIHQVIQQPQQPQQTQYVLATNPQGQTYLVAQQPQPTPIQTQPTQTVLVTQTPQQQSTGTKTIIILQQQTMPTNQQHGQQQLITTGQCGPTQKMIMTTAQGQQVLVTQRPQTPQQQFFINPQTGQATHIQHVSVPVSTVGTTAVMQRQIIQTTAAAQQHHHQQLQQNTTGQISPSLQLQLNQIPATIKLHQAPQSQQQQYQQQQPQTIGVITQTPQQSTGVPRLGKAITMAQKQPPAIVQPSTIQIPPLQQHQSIIQQHIVSGPVEKPPLQQQRQVILSGGRAIEIKETVISQTQPAPQQSQLNSQTIITTQPLSAPNVQMQQTPQPQLRAVIEQHPSIIQQKITVPIQQPQQAVQTMAMSTQTSAQKVDATPNLKQTTLTPNRAATQNVITSHQQAPATPGVVKKLPMAPIKPVPQTQPQPQPQAQHVQQATNTPANNSYAAKRDTASPMPATAPNTAAATATTAAAAAAGNNNNTNQQQKQQANEPKKVENTNSTASTTTTGTATTAGAANASTNQAQQQPNAQATPPPPQQQQQTPPPPPAPAPIDVNWLYICDWRNCPRRKFKSLNDLQHHACAVHCPDHLDPAAEIFCQWGPGPGLCDNIPRKRYSLMTHLIDRHLTPDGLRAAVQRRIATGAHNIQPTQPPVTIVRNIEQSQRVSTASPALSTSSSTSSSTQPSTTAGSSAIHAIKRHTADFINPKELMDENEGPVTKSIRLTSALILRNLVTYTNTAKRALRRYEPQLANVALSNVESSSAISHILFELNN